ncbi:MAG: NADH-quinone oxidoreductase subunit NuoF [Epsilonproteobacteria bacterium]|nr:MAG: NADH-quinone oxidoreductase subunit NuoF [Campylobacterota bacterium]RLA66351.1 MAG: NADH-quinone oxidoreductase subunit NuoF [Campylobacterota bacterium]
MNLDELNEIKEKQKKYNQSFDSYIKVCVAASCKSLKSDQIKDAMREKMDEKCQVKGVGCLGLCSKGPLVSVTVDTNKQILYESVKAEDVETLFNATCKKEAAKLPQCSLDQPFFKHQQKIVLENSGEIDPEVIEDYIEKDGYQALLKVLNEYGPEEVVREMMDSGLRGRGGGGYPTGLKWATVNKARSDLKYVICNADEGDPGAFMDRAVLESDPHRIIEGMAIAAYAVGASRGYIYVRAEYPLAIERLKRAIRKARSKGFLGQNISGTSFNFEVDIRLGAGAFVCGEETALIASIEGKRGQPTPRPPYPAEVGLWGKPTLINNVETFANIAPILRKGGAWYASIGTEKSKGTKVFALAGKIENTGLIEVPMGFKLRDIIFDIGGGVPEGLKFKAVQTGGPSGGCIPEDLLDLHVSYESLREAGSIMGSGGMIIMDETSKMVEVARYFMEFCKSESCGKCTPCRVGTVHMHDILDRIAKGTGTEADLSLLEELCDMVGQTSLCGLGQTAPNPVLSTLKYFRHEYDNLIQKQEQPQVNQ